MFIIYIKILLLKKIINVIIYVILKKYLVVLYKYIN